MSSGEKMRNINFWFKVETWSGGSDTALLTLEGCWTVSGFRMGFHFHYRESIIVLCIWWVFSAC